MQQIILWLVSIEVIGFTSFILTFKSFQLLNDRGFAISKIFGISALSIFSWFISITNIIPRNTLTLYLILITLMIPAIIIFYFEKHQFKKYITENWKIISWLQVIYFSFFCFFILIRYYDPLINHTEQPMDLAFLAASTNTISGIPLDPWLKGETINYYYFGYWIFSDITKLSFLNPEISYNLALATIPALLGISIAGLANNIFTRTNPNFLIGTLAALFSCFLSNTYAIFAWLSENIISSKTFWNYICIEGLQKSEFSESLVWYPTQFWWWFNSTRIINFFGPDCDTSGSDYTITETPFFSYLLGDLHPHMMVAPFIISFITICLLLNKINISKLTPNTIYILVVSILLLSICNFINMWTAPILISILFMIFIIKKLSDPTQYLGRLLIFPIIITITSFLIIIPYVLNLGNSITGIYASHSHTSIKHALIIWIPLWIPIIPYVLKDFITSKLTINIRSTIIISIIVTITPWIIKMLLPFNDAPSGPSLIEFTLPISIMVFISVFSATNHAMKNGLDENSTIMYLISLGFLLVLIPELFYLGDIFENRMNTVFKFYYPAWILFSLGAAYSLKKTFEIFKRNDLKIQILSATWLILAITGICSGLYFVPSAIKSKLEYSEYRSLNGLVHLKESNPDIYKAINFIRNESEVEEGILEATGEWDESGIFSRTTGIQNIINWPGHQIQWRGNLEELSIRNKDVEIIYTSIDNQTVEEKLNLYSIRYAVIGPNEILKYGDQIGLTFDNIGDLVFKNQTIEIYKFRNP